MASDKIDPPGVGHVENRPEHAAQDGEIILGDHAVGLDADELRDQMVAQVKLHKLKFTSMASLQLFFFFFVAYCSKCQPTSTLSTR